MAIQILSREKKSKKVDFSQFLNGVPARDYVFQSAPYEQQIREAAQLLERKLNGLLQEAFLLLDQLAVVAVREGENKRAWELADYSRKVMEIFKWNYSGLTVSFSVAMEEKDGKRCVEILEEMLEALENPLSMRDSILLAHQEKKEGESDFGNQITKALLDSIEREESYAFLRNREDFRKLKEKYTSS